MNQLDLKLSSTLDGSIDLSGWKLVKRSLPRGLMLLALVTLSWGALLCTAWLLHLYR